MDLPSLYSSIEALSQQHDQLRMVRCFLDILSREFNAEDACFYEVHLNNDDEHKISELYNPLTQETMPLDADKNVGQAYKSQETYIGEVSATDSRQCVYPVMIGRQVFGLTVFSLPAHDNKTMEQLGFMTTLFTNLFQLIYKKERDGLTGLLNRLDFEERLHRILNHNFGANRRTDAPNQLCIAIFDIDNFKKVNDDFGHLFGDEVLVHLSQLMNRSFRNQDLICRYGGEEFAIALNGVDIDTAVTILSRFREAVQAYQVPQVGSVTISVGVVQVTEKGLLTSIIDKADKALYYAKENGRNQVHAYETLLAENKLKDVSSGTGDVELF